MTSRMWVVRAGDEARFYDDFKKNRIVAIGWGELGDLSEVKNPAEMKQMIEKAYGHKKLGYRNIVASQIARFVLEFKEGDYVLTYDPKTRNYLIGKISSPYRYDPARKEYHHVRSASWEGEIPRDRLSISTRNSLGAISTLFEVNEGAAKDLLTSFNKPKKEDGGEGKQEEEQQQKEEIKEEQLDKSKEFIKDKISAMDWEELQELVAGILRAMGYKTRISPRGSDRGKDVEASPDGLGLTDPHIVVEVKHREGTMGSQALRSFIAALRPRHKGLYVSTGGFTKEARYEADRANNQVSLIDSDELVNLIIQYYDNFDVEARSLLPLRKIYWPE
jgi:restriction system protein